MEKKDLIASVNGSTPFRIPKAEFDRISNLYPNTKQNSDIGKSAIDIVKAYFRRLDPKVTFGVGAKGSDIKIAYNGVEECFEVKGTNAPNINWNALLVSSKNSHRLLTEGMRLIRVSGVGTQNVTLTFLEYGKHYRMVQEPRWRIERAK